MQDERKSGLKAPSAALTGHLISKNGIKKPIKVYLDSGLISIKCRLFIDDEKVEVTKIK